MQISINQVWKGPEKTLHIYDYSSTRNAWNISIDGQLTLLPLWWSEQQILTWIKDHSAELA